MKGIIFDLDGTLILTESFHRKLYGNVCKRHGVDLSVEDFNQYFAGKKTKEAFVDFFNSKGADSSQADIMVVEFRKEKESVLRNDLENNIILREGTIDLLSNLKRDYKIALGTSTKGEFTRIIIDGLGMKSFFECVVTGDDVKESKPSPECFEKAASLLELDDDECIVVEDSETGIKAANNAKIKCIAIRDPSFGKRDLSNADYIIDDIRDVKKVVDSIS